MTFLGITIVIVLGAVCSITARCYFDFKTHELEYKKEQDKTTRQTADNAMKLQEKVEETNKRKVELEIEKEKSRQLEIKLNYREKHGSSLY